MVIQPILDSLLRTVRRIDSEATLTTLADACNIIVLQSTLKCCVEPPFEESEVNQIGGMILRYITAPPGDAILSILESEHIHFAIVHVLFGRSFPWAAFASEHSNDFLYERAFSNARKYQSCDKSEAIIAYLMAILFRYRVCVIQNDGSVPLSLLIRFVRDAAMYRPQLQNDECFFGGLEETLDLIESQS